MGGEGGGREEWGGGVRGHLQSISYGSSKWVSARYI